MYFKKICMLDMGLKYYVINKASRNAKLSNTCVMDYHLMFMAYVLNLSLTSEMLRSSLKPVYVLYCIYTFCEGFIALSLMQIYFRTEHLGQ